MSRWRDRQEPPKDGDGPDYFEGTCPDGFCMSCWACRSDCKEPGGPYPRDDDIATPEEWEAAGRPK